MITNHSSKEETVLHFANPEKNSINQRKKFLSDD
jgi:hypothetical protein